MYSLVKFMENGVNSEAVVASNWIRKDRVYWSNSINAKRDLECCRAIQPGWKSYELLKVKFVDDDYSLCSSYAFTSEEEAETPEKRKSQSKSKSSAATKLPTPPPIRFTVSDKKKGAQSFSRKSSLTESASPVRKRIRYMEDSPMSSPSAPNTPRSPCAAATPSSSFSISPRRSPRGKNLNESGSSFKKPSKSNGAAYNKDKYPLPEGEFQRKVLLGMSEIINLLRTNKRAASTSHDDYVEKCLSEEEFETLEKTVKEDKAEFKNLVEKVSNIGGSSERECAKNILLTLTTDQVLSFYSGKGLKGKKAFEKMKLFDVVTSGVMAVIKDSSREKVRKEIADVLKHAPARVKQTKKSAEE